MHCANEIRLKATKRIVRYLKGTINFGVKYKKSQHFRLTDFSNSDWAGLIDNIKSTSGYYFNLRLGVFSWCSKK